MKKILVLFIIVTMTFSSVAYAEESTPVETAITENAVYEIGEIVTTEVAEFSLTRFEYGKMLKNASFSTDEEPDSEYLLPTEEVQKNNPFVAEDGKIMISFSYTLKNTGKKELTFPVNMGIYADYNGGYEFEADVNLIKGKYVITKDTTSLDPLSEACEGRGYIEVPLEVMENEEAPLFLSINLPLDNNSETATNVVYNLRSGEEKNTLEETNSSETEFINSDYEIVRTSEVALEDGTVIVHGYNKDDIHISEIVTDKEGNIYEHRYDLDGTHIFESGTLKDGSYHEFEYDKDGNVIKETHK